MSIVEDVTMSFVSMASWRANMTRSKLLVANTKGTVTSKKPCFRN